MSRFPAASSVDEGSEAAEDAAARRISLLALRELQQRDRHESARVDDLPQRHTDGRRRDGVPLAEAPSAARSRQMPAMADSIHAHS